MIKLKALSKLNFDFQKKRKALVNLDDFDRCIIRLIGEDERSEKGDEGSRGQADPHGNSGMEREEVVEEERGRENLQSEKTAGNRRSIERREVIQVQMDSRIMVFERKSPPPNNL